MPNNFPTYTDLYTLFEAIGQKIAESGSSGTVTSVNAGAGLTGGTITNSGTIKANLKSETKSSLTATAMGSTSGRQYAVGLDANGNLSVNVPWTAYSSYAAAKNGTTQSLVTTGEKYRWNITQSELLTLTVDGWDSTTKQQTVALTVDTKRRNVVDITIGELPFWSEYNVYAISESSTGITFQCSTIPEEALTFRVTSMGVS